MRKFIVQSIKEDKWEEASDLDFKDDVVKFEGKNYKLTTMQIFFLQWYKRNLV